MRSVRLWRVVLLLAAIGILWLADVAFALSVLSPLAFVMLASGVLLVGIALTQGLRNRVVVAAILAGCAAGIALTNWTHVKTFARDLHAIKPGMTVEDVHRRMGKYPMGTGWPRNPFAGGGGTGELRLAKDQLVFRASEEPGDSNWGIVTVQSGVVTSVRFSPD